MVRQRYACQYIGAVLFFLLPFFPTSDIVGQDPGIDRSDRAKAKRASETIRVAGEIESARSVDVRSLVPGTNTVLWVVAEGTRVKKGDLLVELDKSKFEDKLQQAKIHVMVAESEMIKTKSQLAQVQKDMANLSVLVKKQNEAETAQRDALFGNGGTVSLEIQEVTNRIAVLETKLKQLAQAKANWRAENGDKPASALETEILECRLDIKLAKAKISYLKNQHTNSLKKKLDFEQAMIRRQLNNDARKLATLKSGYQTTLQKFQQDLDLAQRELQRIKTDITNCRMVAPVDGTVVYARPLARRGTDFVLEPGVNVRERQTLVQIPDMANLQVRTLVNESVITKIRLGHQSTVTVAALPNKRIKGVVAKISRFPAPAGWQDKTRRYPVTIRLLDPPKSLRMQMTATVEIHVDRPARERPANNSKKRSDKSRAKPKRGSDSDAFSVDSVAKRMMERYDVNSDGFVDQDEQKKLPQRFQAFVKNADQNGDKKISAKELKKMTESMMRRFRGGG